MAEQPGHAASRLYATGTDSIWALKQGSSTIAGELSFYDGEQWLDIAFGGEGDYRIMFGVDGVVFVLPNGANDIYMGMIIPEPGTWALLMGISVLGLSVLVRRRRSRT